MSAFENEYADKIKKIAIIHKIEKNKSLHTTE
jgi:hypothetical protein